MNIAKLELENKAKELEIQRKIRIKEILKMKAERIANQRQAVQKYAEFLEDVRSANQDQYTTIQSIIDRHKTLQDLQEKLELELQNKEVKLKTMKSEFSKYESQMNTNTMQLNNTIANLKIQHEMIDDEKNRLKSQE